MRGKPIISLATRRADVPAPNVSTREARETAEETPDLATLEAWRLPRRVSPRVMDMQHWIDLCA